MPRSRSRSRKKKTIDLPKDFIKFICANAEPPVMFGRPIKARKVLQIGDNYYWKNLKTIGKTNPNLKSFNKWLKQEKLTRFNSILINLYESKGNKIGWHSDKTDNLKYGTVISYSFALHDKDKDKELAVMEFGPGPMPKKNNRTLHTLYHGTKIKFNAINDKKKNIVHRVPNTLYPRINITLRKVNI